MANIFSRTRNIELSVVKYISDQISANWNGVTVVKSFPEAYDVKVPVICVRMLSADTSRWEIGSDLIKREYTFVVDIFGSSDGNRIDLQDFIITKVNSGCVYYDCAKHPTNREEIVYTENGRILLRRFLSDMRISFNFDDDQQDKFRQSITFVVSKND